jgi:TonB family protein
MSHSLLSLFIVFMLVACHTTGPVYYEPPSAPSPHPSTSNVSKKEEPQKVLVDMANDGKYTMIEVDAENVPVPRQGTEQHVIDVYSQIRYPAYARENNIRGTVESEVWVNVAGEVTQVTISKSVHPSLDQETLRCVRLAAQPGYEPLIIEDQARPFRVTIPVRFWIQ